MKLKFLHSIPEDIKDKFQKQSEKNSWKIMTILSILTLFMQALNMCHVLFLSSKKTGHAEQPDILWLLLFSVLCLRPVSHRPLLFHQNAETPDHDGHSYGFLYPVDALGNFTQLL